MKTLALIFSALILSSTVLFAQENQNQAVQVALEQEDDVLTLNWMTTQEVNTSYFVIEHLVGDVVHQIATVDAAGHSMHSQEYSYELFEELNENSSFRVSTITMNGELIISDYLVVEMSVIEGYNQMVSK